MLAVCTRRLVVSARPARSLVHGRPAQASQQLATKRPCPAWLCCERETHEPLLLTPTPRTCHYPRTVRVVSHRLYIAVDASSSSSADTHRRHSRHAAAALPGIRRAAACRTTRVFGLFAFHGVALAACTHTIAHPYRIIARTYHAPADTAHIRCPTTSSHAPGRNTTSSQAAPSPTAACQHQQDGLRDAITHSRQQGYPICTSRYLDSNDTPKSRILTVHY